MSYSDFTKMPVWQSALRLLKQIYSVTKAYPTDERFGLISDMRRAAHSIAHNIAEGFGRFEPKDKSRFYKISRGSVYELMSQILVSSELTYLPSELKTNLLKYCRQIIKELNAIIRTVEDPAQPQPQPQPKPQPDNSN